MSFKAKLTGDFVEKIKGMADTWSAYPTITYVITVPPELDWWFYQERGIPHSYTISGNPGLAFEGPDGLTVKKQVIHPGLQPTHTVGTVAASLDRSLPEQIRLAFVMADFEPNATKQFFLQIMEKIKEDIVLEMSDNLPGTHYPDEFRGKLQGRYAADVFNDNAVIIEG